MAERGKHKYAYISATSNTVVRTGPGTLYGVLGTFNAGTVVRIDDTHRFTAGVLDLNAVGSNTVAAFTAQTTGLAIGLDTGLAVAVGSNSKITIEYE